MTHPITLPLWLFVPIALLAAWAAIVLMLAPGLRWFLRRRISRVIEQINQRWAIELPNFKLTRRQVLIDRLFNDPAVQAAASDHAARSGEPLLQVWRDVDRYAREIVPSFNAYIYFRVGYAIARAIARALYRVRIDFVDNNALAQIDRQSTVVFVMNHRSNMDYVLVAFLAAEKTTLSFAVGEWARIWPLQQLIRAMGAFFVRRNSGSPLYRAVLARYVQMATAAGVTQAVFPEGGLTIDGKLRAPRFGLLAYLLAGFDEREGEGRRDLVFIPVGLNYDRVIEDRTQLRKLHPELPRRRRREVLSIVVRHSLAKLWQMVNRRWHRLGYACVNFGQPLSMRAWAREHALHFPALDADQRRAEVSRIGDSILQRIGEVVPVLPVSLVASLMVEAPTRAWSEIEIKAAALQRIEALTALGAHVYLPRGDQDYAIGVGLRMLTLRRVLSEDGQGLFRTVAAELELLTYYANAIAHWPVAAATMPGSQVALAIPPADAKDYGVHAPGSKH
jgi:glycerol-3-phosphate O-acyltransferase